MSEIKQGYKQTKVGIIPEDWEVVKLGEATKINPSSKNLPENFIYIDLESVVDGKLLKQYYISKDEAPSRAQRVLEKNDILFQMVRPYQMNNLFFNFDGNYVASTGYAQIRTDKNVKYIFQYFHLKKFVDNVLEKCTGSNYPAINSTDLSEIPLALPPLKEQEKIAEILTTWDEAITKQTELLEAKELQKKALMQKLLSGEVRFDGFSDKWEEVRLGEIGNSFNGLGGKTGEDFGIGEAKYITYKNIFDYSKIKLDIFENVQISNDEKQNLVQFGDIFFTVSSETPEEVGMSSVLLDNVSNTYLNSFCFGYRLNNFNTLNPYFARFYFRSFQMRDKISRLAQGSTRFNLSKNEIMKLKIKLPSLPEQQKIAEILSLADDEINLLRNELIELKQQKKALMQKLLTGQVRVKV
ncbi:restriction endonuclease subunit S [Aliarcobacter butzleri]|uniref:restriction endonuclease subunit S n=1 Tax=Aliarcobacter butzleri TaxID=28197 RepID=UPI0021B50987|nr:restriction endonuclease subunit S [Aliarcobacter butzleri]MCT7575737.1 restriction endonuclease subunit S [Aliarcobacter butzleri]MCT7622555.1 restriction endonuclease subunit S [Aliarcobacter butzleri]MCT7650551.1 restriction endonuclease subunit S [Aliarcobacter butzleri]